MNNALLYKNKPIFGLDIGFKSLKVMEVNTHNKKHLVNGYGVTTFDPSLLDNGTIINPEGLAKVTQTLFNHNVIGSITTKRVALSISALRTFNRSLKLPKMNKKELDQAVRLEAEQYIPLPIDDLYLDYDVISQDSEQIELLMVAAPRKIVDSYILYARLLGLEVVAIETTINASSRMFTFTASSDIPTILIDFGSISSDITIYDKAIVVTGNVAGGGDSFTASISKALNVNHDESHVIKTKYGLGVSKKQKEITAAITPQLELLLKEIRRMIRYYDERSKAERKIAQVVTMGGGANMPGLSDYMTDKLRLPVRMCHPWESVEFAGLQPPNSVEKAMYITVAGLSLMDSKEIFV